jgi:hypothetical protein
MKTQIHKPQNNENPNSHTNRKKFHKKFINPTTETQITSVVEPQTTTPTDLIDLKNKNPQIGSQKP